MAERETRKSWEENLLDILRRAPILGQSLVAYLEKFFEQQPLTDKEKAHFRESYVVVTARRVATELSKKELLANVTLEQFRDTARKIWFEQYPNDPHTPYKDIFWRCGQTLIENNRWNRKYKHPDIFTSQIVDSDFETTR